MKKDPLIYKDASRYNGEIPSFTVPDAGDGTTPAISSMPFVLPSIDTPTKDLAKDGGKITLLVFGGSGCGSCIEEAQTLAAVTSLHGSAAPTKINLITVLVGDTVSSGRDFKERYKITWPVVIDNDSSLFHTLCPEPLIRCFIFHDPNRGIYFRTQDAMTVAQMKEKTGAWY